MSRVLVLGAGGMLGRAVSSVLNSNGFEVRETFRSLSPGGSPSNKYILDVQDESCDAVLDHLLSDADYVINCIGVLKEELKSPNSSSIARAISVNSQFPISLAAKVEINGAKLLQIATDCVFSGHSGNYVESSPHDPLDVYGKTKSLGEVSDSNFVMTLRTSIVGPELKNQRSLLEWVRNVPKDGEIDGYVNHLWNGVTSLAFANVVSGIISNRGFESGVHHLVPQGYLSKYELVSLLAERLGRNDIKIHQRSVEPSIDRRLSTEFPKKNKQFWEMSPYKAVPDIKRLILGMTID